MSRQNQFRETCLLTICCNCIIFCYIAAQVLTPCASSRRPSPTERQLIPVAFVSEKWFEISCWQAEGLAHFLRMEVTSWIHALVGTVPICHIAHRCRSLSRLRPFGDAAPLWQSNSPRRVFCYLFRSPSSVQREVWWIRFHVVSEVASWEKTLFSKQIFPHSKYFHSLNHITLNSWGLCRLTSAILLCIVNTWQHGLRFKSKAGKLNTCSGPALQCCWRPGGKCNVCYWPRFLKGIDGLQVVLRGQRLANVWTHISLSQFSSPRPCSQYCSLKRHKTLL